MGWRRSRATTLGPKRARPIRNWRQMLDNKRTTFLALIGAVALLTSAPAFAQEAAPAAPAADAAAAAPAADAAAAPAAAPTEDVAPPTIENAGKLTVTTMFLDAHPIVKA